MRPLRRSVRFDVSGVPLGVPCDSTRGVCTLLDEDALRVDVVGEERLEFFVVGLVEEAGVDEVGDLVVEPVEQVAVSSCADSR